MINVTSPGNRLLGFTLILTCLGATALAMVLLSTRYDARPNSSPQASAARSSGSGLAASASDRSKAEAARPRPRPTRAVRFSVLGIPLEVFGLAWFLVIGAVAWCAASSTETRRARLRVYLFALSLVAATYLIFVGIHAGADFILLGKYQLAACALAAAVCIVAALGEQAPWRDVFGALRQDVGYVFSATVTWIAIASFLGVAAFRPRAEAAASANSMPTGEAFLPWYVTQPRVAMPDLSDSPVLLVKVNDFQCPPCRASQSQYEPVLNKLRTEFPEAIKFVMVDYPLEPECNKYVELNVHPAACEAAVAVRLARDRNKGKEMEAWLWEHQLDLTPEAVKKAIHDIAGVADFARDYDRTLAAVVADIERAHAWGVQGTPTHFINGVKLTFIPPSDLETALRHEISQSGRNARATQ